MRKSHKLQIERTEVSDRLNEISLLEGEKYNDAIREEEKKLQERHRDLGVRFRTALLLEGDEEKKVVENNGDLQTRERIELRDRCKLVNFILGMRTGKLNGAEQELSSELKLEPGEVPMELWETNRPKTREAEKRAITEAPGTVGLNLAPIRPYVFAPSIASYLGIQMPMVPSGTYASATITTALSAGARAKGDDQAATAAAFTVTSSTPKSVSSRLEFNIVDIAAAGTNLESALRENVSMVMGDALDDAVINGTGSSNQISGLFQKLTDPSADGTVLTFDHGLSKLADLTDGLWAFETAQIRQVVGVETYKLAAKSVSVPATGGKGELTLADYLRMHSGGFRTNSRMPDVSSTKQPGLAFRAGRPGIAAAIVPSWGRIQIDDPYTNSAKGQRNITVHALVGDMILTHPAAFAQVEYKVS